MSSFGDPMPAPLETLTQCIVGCRKCPRLVRWRERIAREKRAAFRDETYWGKPVPGFGDPNARMLLVGLAPAAHGGNRTGRVFTGDRGSRTAPKSKPAASRSSARSIRVSRTRSPAA